MLKFSLTIIALLITSTMVFADITFPEVTWGPWKIKTPDLMMSEEYPVTNMLDGAPQTAWVFNKTQYGSVWKQYKHGEGEEMHISYNGDPITIDNISIINGYAKNEAIYQLNNRILKLEVYCTANSKTWNKTFDLKETRSPQRLDMPKITSGNIEIQLKVVQVALGDDDDLCISEFALCDGDYHIPYNVPATIIANDTNGGPENGMDYYLLNPSGKKVEIPGVQQKIRAISTLPDSGNALIWCDDHKLSGTIYVCNLITQRLLYSHTFTNDAQKASPPILANRGDTWFNENRNLGWLDPDTALICLSSSEKDKGIDDWYRISLKDGFSIKLFDDQVNPKFLPGIRRGACYGLGEFE